MYLFIYMVGWLFIDWNKKLKRTKAYVIILPNYIYLSLASKWSPMSRISVLVVDSGIYKYIFLADIMQKTHNKWELKAWPWWISMFLGDLWGKDP